MTYKVTILPEVKEFVRTQDEKSRRIIRKNLAKLEHPHPGEGIGDKERLPVEGEMIYRLHIGRTWTAFYIIMEEEARVIEILPIAEAHKNMGFEDIMLITEEKQIFSFQSA